MGTIEFGFPRLGSPFRAFLRSCESFHVTDLPRYRAARHRLNLDRTDAIFHRAISLASKLTNANGGDTSRRFIRERTTAVGPSKEEREREAFLIDVETVDRVSRVDFSHQVLCGDSLENAKRRPCRYTPMLYTPYVVPFL